LSYESRAYPKLIPAGSRIDLMFLGIGIRAHADRIDGHEARAPMDVRSQTPLLEGRKSPWRPSFLIECFSDRTMQRMLNMVYQSVRMERWKHIHHTELQGMDELYDLRRDPFEMHNLIADAAVRGTVESLRADLQRRRQ